MLPFQKNLSPLFNAILALPATAVGFALSTQIAALSWILSKKYGLDIHEVAFVWLAGPVAGIFGQVIVGLISDNVWFMGGRRRPFIIIGGIVSSIAFLSLPYIQEISNITGVSDIIIVASVIALFLDLSVNVTFNPARSIIADLTPEGKQRTAGYVWMQIVSGFFGVFAYFLSMLFGNVTLLYIAAILVFIMAVFPILLIEETKTEESESDKPSEIFGVWQIVKEIYPLYGFLVFGLYSVFNHFFEFLSPVHNPILILSLLYSIIIGIIIILKGLKNPSDKNEFQKIMLAHSFTWVAFQSMFIMSGFFIENRIMPNVELSGIIANWFAEKLTGVAQTADSSIGNIVSLGFLILNFIGAVFPIALQAISKRIGRVKTYISALSFTAIGYFYIAFLGTIETDFYIGMMLAGIGWSAVISIVFAIMSERVNPLKMGLFMGVFNLAVVLPQMMSNGVANVIKQTNDYQLLYIFCGLFIVTSVIFWVFVKEPLAKAEAAKTPLVSSGH
ncbi:MAG: MFS transporter [Bacteroidales bacterium]|nr:MFS transporter [Bacteroidales bacterium]